MKKYLSKFIIITMIIVLAIVLRPVKSNAGFQANKGGTSKVSVTASDFFSLIRGMETGTLGKSNVGAADDIDCHMAKNTEWGGAAILAACSSYGVIPTGTNSTTGNESGIYSMAGGKYEYTANYITGNTQTFAKNITDAGANESTKKYVNAYASSSARIPGDALSMGSLDSNWSASDPVVARGFGSLFGYVGCSNYHCGGRANSGVGSRAAVVCGSGL